MLFVSFIEPALVPLPSRASCFTSTRALRCKLKANPAPLPIQSHQYYSHQAQLPHSRQSHIQRIDTAKCWKDSRTFVTTTKCLKGQKFKDRGDAAPEEQRGQDKRSSQTTATIPITEALSLTPLRAEITRIHDKLRKSLSTLKPGGQFNPVFIESLRVDLSKLANNTPATPVNARNHAKATQTKWVKNDPETHEQQKGQQKKTKNAPNKNRSGASSAPPTVPLKDIAQVISRGGKTAVIMLNEEDFIKPVTSALLNSPYSLNPQPSEKNTLELLVPIPAPSAEMRKLNVSQVDKYLERAEHDLREGRGEMQKTLRALSLSGHLRPDDHVKGSKDMEKVMDDAKAEIKRLCDASKKALQ